jgi:hypothetical protein
VLPAGGVDLAAAAFEQGVVHDDLQVLPGRNEGLHDQA